MQKAGSFYKLISFYLRCCQADPQGNAQAKKEMNDIKNPVVVVLRAVEIEENLSNAREYWALRCYVGAKCRGKSG